MLAIIFIAVLCLSFANGANDNFKGVTTLFGSGTCNYRVALTWATVTTLLGSVTATFLAVTLLKTFSGKGLVEPALAATVEYASAVALGAGLTVFLASRIGMPVSTTHGLVGALIGSGLAAESAINVQKLVGGFFIPLLISPVLAVLGTLVVYPIFTFIRQRCGLTSETCLCIGNKVVETVPGLSSSAIAMQRAEQLAVEMGDTVSCQSHYQGRMFGFNASTVLDSMHFLSAGIVSFARGLNDTPKIAALLLLAPAFGEVSSTALVGLAIALGGVVYAKRVAETMSQKITPMNHGQGFTANLVTGVIVIGASRLGLPVSTTHVSCGSIFGIGAVTKQANWETMFKILGAWVLTLPLGAGIGFASYWIIRHFH
ncbi:MAG: inorganic phosphate transporter [Planctomycetota bacterium]